MPVAIKILSMVAETHNRLTGSTNYFLVAITSIYFLINMVGSTQSKLVARIHMSSIQSQTGRETTSGSIQLLTGRNASSIQLQTGRSKVLIDIWFIRSIRSKTGRNNIF